MANFDSMYMVIPEGWKKGYFFFFTKWKYHPGGAIEIRGGGGPGAKNGHGNQCVYDECGKLIKTIPTAGTADWKSPDLFGDKDHNVNDVDPFNLALEFNEVEEYYKVRPSIYADESGNVYVNGKKTTKNYTQR